MIRFSNGSQTTQWCVDPVAPGFQLNVMIVGRLTFANDPASTTEKPKRLMTVIICFPVTHNELLSMNVERFGKNSLLARSYVIPQTVATAAIPQPWLLPCETLTSENNHLFTVPTAFPIDRCERLKRTRSWSQNLATRKNRLSPCSMD